MGSIRLWCSWMRNEIITHLFFACLPWSKFFIERSSFHLDRHGLRLNSLFTVVIKYRTRWTNERTNERKKEGGGKRFDQKCLGRWRLEWLKIEMNSWRKECEHFTQPQRATHPNGRRPPTINQPIRLVFPALSCSTRTRPLSGHIEGKGEERERMGEENVLRVLSYTCVDGVKRKNGRGLWSRV